MAIDTEVKMDPELKKKWVDALRSGEYKQGQGALRDEGCNCCLGVLADIQEIRTHERWNGSEYIFEMEDGAEYRSAYMPPSGFCGLNEHTMNHLAEMNDGNSDLAVPVIPKSFDEIATYIEENL